MTRQNGSYLQYLSDKLKYYFITSKPNEINQKLEIVTIIPYNLPNIKKVYDLIKEHTKYNFISAISEEIIKEWSTDCETYGFKCEYIKKNGNLTSINISYPTSETSEDLKNIIPEKSTLEKMFEKSNPQNGKSRSTSLWIDKKHLDKDNKNIHGYKYLISNKQALDKNLLNIIVFEKNNSCFKQTSNLEINRKLPNSSSPSNPSNPSNPTTNSSNPTSPSRPNSYKKYKSKISSNN